MNFDNFPNPFNLLVALFVFVCGLYILPNYLWSSIDFSLAALNVFLAFLSPWGNFKQYLKGSDLFEG